METGKRIAWIDVAKGIGIWLVVAGHLLPTAAGDAATTAQTTMAASLLWSFHIPLFFFLSGLTARPAGPEGCEPELARSVRGIAAPYLFFSLLSIALWWAHPDRPDAARDPFQALAEMVYGVSGEAGALAYNVPLWFFTCLFSVRLLFLALSLRLASPAMLLAASLALAAAAHAALAAALPPLAWNADIAPVALVFFAAGHWLAGRNILERPIAPSAGLLGGLAGLVALGLIVAANGRVDMNLRIFGNPWLFYAGAAVGTALVALLAKALAGQRWLAAIGRASIVIFPMHALLWHFLPARTLPVLGWYAARATGSTVASAFAVGAVEIALCLPLYWLFMRTAPRLIGNDRNWAVAANPAGPG